MTTRFFAALGAATLWAALASLASVPWVADLSVHVGPVAAWALVAVVAVVPGWLAMFLASSLVQYDGARPDLDQRYPPLSVLIVTRDSEGVIEETVRYLDEQDYPGPVEVVAIDDGSSDGTRDVLGRLEGELGPDSLRVLEAARRGPAHALRMGVKAVSHEYVVTLDPGTLLRPSALRRIVARMLTDTPSTAAVAGAVLVRNSRESFVSRIQEWDYFLTIASVARQQALYGGTLAARRAFSLFRRDAVLAVGGWPDGAGEDLVLTRMLIRNGYRVGFEGTAVGFAMVPESTAAFVRQRRDWARGAVAALRESIGPGARRHDVSGFLAATEILWPVLGLAVGVLFIPAAVLAASGRFWVAGPMVLLVLPPALLTVWMILREQRCVFEELGLRMRRNAIGCLGYLLVYPFVTSPASVWGYAEELRRPSRGG